MKNKKPGGGPGENGRLWFSMFILSERKRVRNVRSLEWKNLRRDRERLIYTHAFWRGVDFAQDMLRKERVHGGR